MIQLHQFAPVWGLPNASPFCMKLETYLRMAGLPYATPAADIRKAPKGKMPYIEDAGTTLGDSSLIIDYLKSRYGDPLDGHLRDEERAQALAWRVLMEEHLYWCLVYERWAIDANWELARAAYFGFLPAAVRRPLAALIRRKTLKQLQAQGTGRHARDEIYAIAKADVSALSTFLGTKPFFLGERPTSLDATAYAFIGNILWAPIESPLKAHALSLPNLAPYCERMKARYFASKGA